MKYLLLFLIAFSISCADLSPKKDFTSTLYAIDWESRCMTYVDNESGQTLMRCFAYSEQDPQGNWHKVDTNGKYMDDIIGISDTDFKKEVDFQNLLKKQCSAWKTSSPK